MVLLVALAGASGVLARNNLARTPPMGWCVGGKYMHRGKLPLLCGSLRVRTGQVGGGG